MTIECTPRELAELLRNLQNGGPVWKAVDLPAAVRETVKPYLGKREEETHDSDNQETGRDRDYSGGYLC